MKRLTIFATLSLAFAGACSDDANNPKDAAVRMDAGADSGGPDAACFTNPTTHNEIINACTQAQKIYKDSHPPLTLPDGGLPQLP